MHQKQAALPAHRQQQQQQQQQQYSSQSSENQGAAHWSSTSQCQFEPKAGEAQQLQGQKSRLLNLGQVQQALPQTRIEKETRNQQYPFPQASNQQQDPFSRSSCDVVCGPGEQMFVPLMQGDSGSQQSVPNPVAAPYQSGREQANLVHGGAGSGVSGAQVNKSDQIHNEAPNVNRQVHMISKGLAHSTSALAHDSYTSGMSSDSELTSRGHHHQQRPYSSQSRAYHAHPAPRTPHASSRLSHQSDPASSLTGGSATAYLTGKQQTRASADQLAYQPSTGSNSYLAAGSPALHHHQQMRSSSSGRHLPHRPFEQSMSIDHHLVGMYQQQASQARQLPQLSQLGSPMHYDAAEQQNYGHQPQQQQQQQQDYSMPIPGAGASQTAHYQNRYERALNLKLELEMMEKRAAGISLGSSGTAAGGDEPTGASIGSVHGSTSSSAGLPPAAVRPSSGRQLPPLANQPVSSISVDQVQLDHLQHQHQHNQHHHQQQQQHNLYPQAQQQHHQAPDWLPPMGSAQQIQHSVGTHFGRSGMAASVAAMGGVGQFKQAMSIDHYPLNQQQQRHYSPNRTSHFGEHYRSSPLGAYDSPSQQLPPSGADLHNDISPYHHYPQSTPQQQLYSQQVDPQLQRKQQLESVHQYSSLAAKQMSQQQAANLQRQISSSSSNNSQSGSLRSSNIDINKSVLDDQHQGSSSSSAAAAVHSFNQVHGSPQHNKQQTAPTYGQQQHRLMMRKGFTSLASNLGSGYAAMHEPTDPSSSFGTGPLLASYGATKRSAALRANSPSAALAEFSASPCASSSQQPPQYAAKQQHHSSSSAREVAAPGDGCGTRSESSTGLPNGLTNSSSLTKKSNSATQLSMTGTKKRLGFRKKQVTSFSVHRSEEVVPPDARHLVKQGSSVSEGESSLSGDSSSRSWSNSNSNSNFKQQTPDELASLSFIDGLGKGQMISRQGLASPYLGDIQLSLCDRRGNLEVEVIRARNLQAKANKILPLTYVKLYLVKNRKCLAKAKTALCNKRTLDPLFQEQLSFHEDYHGSILQSIVWGNFGKMDKKNFMGIAQISIDDLDLSDTVISWYKLFLPSSLQTLPSKSLRHTLLSNSTESFTNNTNNSQI